MGLIAYYPLSGTLEDYGPNHNTATIGGAVIAATDGPLGKCYQFTPTLNVQLSSYILIPNYINELNGKHFTFSIRFKSSGLNGQTIGGLFSLTYGLRNYISADGKIIFIKDSEDTGNNTDITSNTSGYFDNKWHHLAITCDSNTISMYIDGKLDAYVNNKNMYNTIYSNSGYIGIDCNDSSKYAFTGYICDFRIYDEVLSHKDITEINNCCILHYDFNSPSSEPTTNIVKNPGGKILDPAYTTPGVYKPGWNASLHTDAVVVNNWSSGYNPGVASPAVGYHAKWVYEGISGSTDPCMKFIDRNSQYGQARRWLGISQSLATPNALGWSVGTTLTLSWYQKSDTANKGIRAGIYKYSISNGNYNFEDSWDYKAVDMPNVWERFTYTFTVTSDWDLTKSLILYVYGSYGDVEGTLWCDDVQLEVKNHATPYVDGTRAGIVYDSSGLRRNGTIALATSPSYSTDTNIGTGCYYFDNTGMDRISVSYFINPNQITINSWFKSSVVGLDSYQIICAAGSANEVSIDSRGEIRTGFVIDGSIYVENASGTNILDGQWHMITSSYDGITKKTYKDGVLVKSTAKAGVLTQSQLDMYIGKYTSATTYGAKDAYISDFRIYGTALTDDEVKTLYNNKAYVDNAGNINSTIYNEKYDLTNHETKSFYAIAAPYGYESEVGVGLYNADGTRVAEFIRDWHICVWDRRTFNWATNINFYGASVTTGGFYGKYDVYGEHTGETSGQMDAFVKTLQNLDSNYIVVIAGSHAPEYYNTAMANEIRRCGGIQLNWAYTRNSYICVGIPGCGEGNAIAEAMNNMAGSGYMYAKVPFTLRKETVSLSNKSIFNTMQIIENNRYTPTLVDYENWNDLGSGILPGWQHEGSTAENNRIIASNPWGVRDYVWEGTTIDGNDSNGGFVHTGCPIDNSKKYRVSVWMKLIPHVTAPSGSYYFGCRQGDSVSNLGSTTVNTNPYFICNQLSGSSAIYNKWVLLVAYIWPSSYSSTTVDSTSGGYNINGDKLISSMSNFKFLSNATTGGIRSFLYYVNVGDATIYLYRPRFEVADTACSISTLLQGREHCSLYQINNSYVPSISSGGKIIANGIRETL